MKYVLIFFACAVYFVSKGQNISTLYTHGGTLSDELFHTIPTLDSGLISVGITSSFSSSCDVFLIKTNKYNSTEWTHALGGNGVDRAYTVGQLPDSSYIISGYSNSYSSGDYDGFIMKTDKFGFIQQTIPFGGSDWDLIYGMTILPDSGLALCGSTYSGTNGYSDAWILRLDKNYNVLWEKKSGGVKDDEFHDVIFTSDAALIACGHTWSDSSQWDNWIVKYNLNGDTLFTFHAGDSLKDLSFTVLEHNIDSGYVIGGSTNSYTLFPEQSDGLRLKISRNGLLLWSHAEGGAEDDCIYDIEQFPDGKLIMCGLSSYGAGLGDVLNFITDPGGWWMPYSPTYGGTEKDYANSIVRMKNGKFAIAGYTESFGAGLSDGMLIIADSVSSNYSFSTITGSDTLLQISVLPDNDCFFRIYPNPVHGNGFSISSTMGDAFDISVYTLDGREIYSCNHIILPVIIPVLDFCPGVYCVKVYNQKSVHTAKVVISK